jgi:hypothetical protein
MLTCPMCKKKLRGLERQCLSCRADVSLLVDYVQSLQEGLARAESLTREGELGEAVWAYLEVLEVDPDNGPARRQVGKVVTAVRQFDTTAPGRRWLTKLHKENRWRRRLAGAGEGGAAAGWKSMALWFVLLFGIWLVGYTMGVMGQSAAPPPSVAQTQPAEKGDKGKKPAEENKGAAAEPARP